MLEEIRISGLGVIDDATLPLGPGLTVRIGAENQRADLLGCSLVLAPYLVEGEVAGTIGVLGPTRMDYRRAQAAVATVSQRLGKQLSP